MYDFCVMPWKIFLELFKENYSMFIYYNEKWHFKSAYNDIPIKLNYSPDNQMYFCNSLFNKVTSVKKEELQWNPINKNIIIY